MLDKNIKRMFFAVSFVTALALIHPAQSFAWDQGNRNDRNGPRYWHNHNKHHHNHSHSGWNSHPHRQEFIKVSRPSKYYYYNNRHNPKRDRDCVLIKPQVNHHHAERAVYPAKEASISINVPTGKGGYVSVVLRQGSKGFYGPRGEFYSEMPRIEYLSAVYGR